jgi:hypothetical protein
MFKKIIILYLLIFSTFLFSKTAEELLNPKNNAYDFTLTNNNSLNEYTPTQYVDKVEMSVDKILGLVPRTFNTFDCKNDIYGNDYCPASLAPADVYWDSLDGYSSNNVGSVTDYTSKINIKFFIKTTNSLRLSKNFEGLMYSSGVQRGDGYIRQSGNSIAIGQPNGSGIHYLSFDNTTNSLRLSKNFEGLIYSSGVQRGDGYIRQSGNSIAIGQPNGSGIHYLSFDNTTNSLRLSKNFEGLIYSSGVQRGDGHIRQSGNSIAIGQPNGSGIHYLSIITSCASGYVYNGTNCEKSTLACPDGYTETTGTETSNGQCKRTIEYTYYNYLCNSDSITQGYDYIPTNTGGDCTPTSTSDLIDTNGDGIGDSCNSSIPPNDNCKREGFKCKNEFEYELFTNGISESGVGSATDYTSKISETVTTYSNFIFTLQYRTVYDTGGSDSGSTVDTGWITPTNREYNTTGSVGGEVGAVSLDYSPISNRGRFIRISNGILQYRTVYDTGGSDSGSTVDTGWITPTNKEYNTTGSVGGEVGAVSLDYSPISSTGRFIRINKTCPSGYSLNGTTCQKTTTTLSCPSSYTETTGTDTANGECKNTVNYTYYNYKCNSDETVLNEGGNIQKVDTDKTSINTEILSSDLNSSTPPLNNCKKVIGVGKAAFVDGEWKCSPFMCNGDMKCGFGTCEGFSVSNDNYMSSVLNPLKSEVKLNTSDCNTSYEYIDGNSTVHYIKYCTNGIIENAICLEKDINNKCIKFDTTNPDAKCKSGTTIIEPTKQYTYYTYSCPSEKNSFGFNWEIINNITTDPGCIDDTFGKCLNFEKLSNNCKRKTLSCTTGNCQFQSSINQWKCVTGTISLGSSSCNSPICDLVLNSEISYCENEVCPTINGIYERNNQCYTMLCPDGTFEINGKCGVE